MTSGLGRRVVCGMTKPELTITEEIILPIVHMNGTSAGRLIEELSDAADALRRAYDAVKTCAPNGRDYYPEPGRMQKAEEQHRRRLLTIQYLQDELDKEIALLDDVGTYDGPHTT